MTGAGALLLAGGGHSHALLLKRWAMQPERRPQQSTPDQPQQHSPVFGHGARVDRRGLSTRRARHRPASALRTTPVWLS